MIVMLQKRSDKIAFMGIVGEGSELKFTRMTGFTELSKSMNPETYERKYVDENTQRSDVVSYAPEYSFSVDRDTGSPASNLINEVFEMEKVGDDAKIDIVVVDMLSEDRDGAYKATKRTYSVIPDSEDGDSALVQGGTFKACGETIYGTASSQDGWKTCTFQKAAA